MWLDDNRLPFTKKKSVQNRHENNEFFCSNLGSYRNSPEQHAMPEEGIPISGGGKKKGREEEISSKFLPTTDFFLLLTGFVSQYFKIEGFLVGHLLFLFRLFLLL